MTTTNWQRIRDAFAQCIQLPQSERASYLRQTFNGDEASRNQVLQLLQGDRQARSTNYLEWDTNTVTSPTETLTPGTEVGRFQIVEYIGSGGCGVVYKAALPDSDDQFFAIKVLQSWRRNPDDVRRFQQEIDVLRQLDHPGIAKCIEYGSDGDSPFLVMPFVDGEPLHRYLQQQDVPLRQRMEWFELICQAVGHAHEHLILHRDLKPANIMIDRDESPVVMDFGLAKLVDEASDPLVLTTTGRILGTPRYMAPEQSDGKAAIGMTTDVYGLGSVLYHLLTGRAPFEGQDVFAVGHAIRTQRPEDPRSLDPTIDRDLVTICLKCLEKEPADRYPAVSELARDVNRYLEGVPISAKPRSALQQLVDWARINPWLATLSGLSVVMLVTGLLSTSFLWQQSETHKDLLLSVVRQRIEDVDASDRDPSTLVKRARDLRIITDTLAKMGQTARLDEATQRAAAVAWFKLGRVENFLGNNPTDQQAYTESLARFRQLAIRYPNNLQYQFDIFHCLNSLRRHDEALNQARTLVAADGEQNPDYLAALGAELHWQANHYLETGDFDRGLVAAREGLEFATRQFGPKDGNSPYRRRIANFERLLGRLQLVEGDLDSAIEYLNSSSSLSQMMAAEDPTNDGLQRDLGRTRKLLFSIYFHQVEVAKSEQVLMEMESASAAFLNSFGDFYQAWQAQNDSLRLRWIFELEHGTQETAALAAVELRDYLEQWSIRFPEKTQSRIDLAWLLSHPANHEQDLASAEQWINELPGSELLQIRHSRLPFALSRLGKSDLAEQLQDHRPDYKKRSDDVLSNYQATY